MMQTKITDFFDISEFTSISGDLEGKILIINPDRFAPEYQKREYLLWKATGGFGCDPNLMGRAVLAVCLKDGEEVRFNREDFIGIYVGKDGA